MEHETVNFEVVAKLRGISVEQARSEFSVSLAETRQHAEAFLAAHPDLRKQFETEYERDKTFREQRGLPSQEREAFLRSRALDYEIQQRILDRGTKIKASEITTEFGGELPKGWDDLLPPNAIANDTNA